MTSKAQLAALAAAHRLAFVPRTAATARELTRLLPAPHSTGVETGVETAAALMPWLAKAPTHRGVTAVPGGSHAQRVAAAAALLRAGQIVQQRVADPFLVDGRAFDVGVRVRAELWVGKHTTRV
jgi:hypothetical protein